MAFVYAGNLPGMIFPWKIMQCWIILLIYQSICKIWFTSLKYQPTSSHNHIQNIYRVLLPPWIVYDKG